MPRQVFLDLWRTQEQNARRNALLGAELARIVTVLEANGVPALAFKGPALAEQLYGRVELREFEDLDILIPVDQLPRAKAVLLSDRYDVAEDLPAAAEAAMYRSPAQYHRVFVQRDTGEKLEVHWKTDPYFPIEPANDPAWWSSLGRMRLAGTNVRAMGDTDLLLLLCLHATKHQAHRLSWILEIAQLIHLGGVDWSAINDRTRALRIRRRVNVALLLAVTIFEAAVPETLIAQMRGERAVVEAAAMIQSRLFTPDANELSSARRLWLNLALRDTAGQRARHLYDVTFAPTQAEWTRYRLPEWLGFLYVPLRVIRLVVKYGSAQFRS